MHITAGQRVGNHLDLGVFKTQTRQRYRGSHIGVARVLQRSLTGRAAKKRHSFSHGAQIKLLLGGTAGPGLRRLSRAVSDLPQAGQTRRRQPVHPANGTGRQQQTLTGSAAEQLLDLGALTQAATFFHGSAREAALQYPRNANVAATVALAGLGFEGTTVEMIADPLAGGNVHEIEAEGAGGQMSTRLCGLPDPQNPRTSLMTAYSVVRCILNETATVVI